MNATTSKHTEGSPERKLRREVKLMAMNGLAVKVLLIVALCVLAATLAMLLVPGFSWAAVLEWLTRPAPCACINSK